MQVNNNINAMTTQQLKLDQLAQNLATVANVVGDSHNQEVTADLIKSITEQIPTVISYEANANAIKTQNAVADVLLDLKA